MIDPKEIEIKYLGNGGDGIGFLPEGRIVYVPYTAPGDRVSITLDGKQGNGSSGRIKQLVSPGSDRVSPVCNYFGSCGGCALQHMVADRILAFKRKFLEDTLTRRGFKNIQLDDPIPIPCGTRRRIEFTITNGSNPIIGLYRRRSKKIVAIESCPLVKEEISKIILPLQKVIAKSSFNKLARKVRITLSDNGLDILFHARSHKTPHPSIRNILAKFSAMHDIARISWSDTNGIEPIYVSRPPYIHFSTTRIYLPLKYFLQPCEEGETTILKIVRQAIGKAKNVADLFAGCGSIAIPISDTCRVIAYEIGTQMVTTMRKGAAGKSLMAEERDLARSPLTEIELKKFDAVILNPPRAGARIQAEVLSRSAVKTVVCVSCNPKTLARDLRILVNGGYRIDRLTPIDQFTWSPELEIVAVLTHI